MQSKTIIPLFLSLLLFVACNNNNESSTETTTTTDTNKTAVITEDMITYTLDTVNMIGVIVYDVKKEGKKPAVLIVPEWWGRNEYPLMRARQLAELGYVAMAVDIYGDGKVVETPKEAGALSTPFYQNPQMAKARFDAAIAKLKTYSYVDTTKMAAIGYCFGGGLLLNSAQLGEQLSGIVSFHGILPGTPPNKDLMKTPILVCHGAADSFVSQAAVDQFKKQMDSIGANYTFKTYADAKHAFTNPRATEVGQKQGIDVAYNAAADTASWNDMKDFLKRVFK